jgi:hypothetical protein
MRLSALLERRRLRRIEELSCWSSSQNEEKGSDMQFQLVYTNAGWNARLFNARGELVFWTREYDYKQEVIDICDEVRMGVPHAPIRDADTD